MKLSIITINYNNCEGLRKTIDSIIYQTWQDFEWIIVDGGSTDGSRELIEETAGRLENQRWTTERFSGPNDPASFITEQSSSNGPSSQIVNPSSPHRLLWCSEQDKGIYNAMNKGIVRARGEYCLFLNSGDYLYSDDVLLRIIRFDLKEDFVYGILKEKKHGILETKDVPIESFSGETLYRGTLPHPATFIKRILFDKFGLYNENLRIVSDWEFFLKAIVFGAASVQKIPVEISVFDDNGISSVQKDKRNEERQKIINQFFSPALQKDMSKSSSFTDITQFVWSRLLYSVLYRLVIFVSRFNKTHR